MIVTLDVCWFSCRYSEMNIFSSVFHRFPHVVEFPWMTVHVGVDLRKSEGFYSNKS